MLPALVEGLGLVHAVPVATKVAAVPVVTVVAILVAKVATVTTSLMELARERGRNTMMLQQQIKINRVKVFSELSTPGCRNPPGRDVPCFRRGSCCLHLLCSCSLGAMGRPCSWVPLLVPCYLSLGRPWGIRPGWGWGRRG